MHLDPIQDHKKNIAVGSAIIRYKFDNSTDSKGSY